MSVVVSYEPHPFFLNNWLDDEWNLEDEDTAAMVTVSNNGGVAKYADVDGVDRRVYYYDEQLYLDAEVDYLEESGVIVVVLWNEPDIQTWREIALLTDGIPNENGNWTNYTFN